VKVFLGRRLLLVSMAALIALLLSEGIVRFLRRAPDFKPLVLGESHTAYQRSQNPLLGFELKPSYRNDQADGIVSYPSTNSFGQRDIERSLEKRPAVKRVLLLGDSVVEGQRVLDLDQTISRQTEGLYADGTTEVLNFGVAGYCTRAEVELLEVKGLKFHPDVVVVVFVENDFQNFNRQLCELGGVTPRPAWANALFRHSHLFRLSSLTFNWFQFQPEVDPLSWNQRALGSNNVVDGLHRLAQLAREHHFVPLVAAWPMFSDQGVEDVAFAPGGKTLLIELLCAAEGIRCLRLSQVFEEAVRSMAGGTSPRLVFTTRADRMHPNAAGARVAAIGLKTAIDALGEDPPPLLPPLSADAAAAQCAADLGRVRPDLADVHIHLGLTLMREERNEEAVLQFEEALKIQPLHFQAHNDLGIVLARLGRTDDALAHFEESVRVKPENAEAHFNLARALDQVGRKDEAELHRRKALDLRPDFKR